MQLQISKLSNRRGVLGISSLTIVVILSVTALHDFSCSIGQPPQQPGSWLPHRVDSAPPTVVLPDVERLAKSIDDRPVNIKVGVLTPEARKAGDIWVEFDPTVQQAVSETRMILPFIAAPVSQELATFFIHALGGCSSALTPSNAVKDQGRYRQDGMALCERAMATKPVTHWKRWDTAYPSAAGFQATFAEAADACFVCQEIGKVQGVRRFPAIALPEVLSWFKHIDMLDIDAQGMDVALVLSAAQHINKVQHVKLECQVHSSFLYHPEFAGHRLAPNNCTIAFDFLEQHGFACAYEMNNCACDEWNVVCSKT